MALSQYLSLSLHTGVFLYANWDLSYQEVSDRLNFKEKILGDEFANTRLVFALSIYSKVAEAKKWTLVYL